MRSNSLNSMHDGRLREGSPPPPSAQKINAARERAAAWPTEEEPNARLQPCAAIRARTGCARSCNT